MSDKQKKLMSPWIWVFLVATFIFALASPLIFTRPAFVKILDYGNDGNVGETIGGIAGTVVAAIGVVVTFWAFSMQVKENRDQEERFKMTRDDEKNKEKQSRLNRLKLMLADIEKMLEYIRSMDSYCRKYSDNFREDPCAMNRLNRQSTMPLKRIQGSNREDFFSALSFEDTNPESHLNVYYDSVDYLVAAHGEIVKISDDCASSIYKHKCAIIELLMMDDCLMCKPQIPSLESNFAMFQCYLMHFISEHDEGKESDFNELMRRVSQVSPILGDETIQLAIDDEVSNKIKSTFNLIRSHFKNIVDDANDNIKAINEYSKNIKGVLEKLQKLKSNIDCMVKSYPDCMKIDN